MNIQGNSITVKKSAKELYEHLCKLENFEELMPENLEKFEVDGDSFLFGLKGMPEIRLVVTEKEPHSKIILGAASSALNFSLNTYIDEVSDNTCTAQLSFDGKFNAMMAMMVKRPLKKLIEVLTDNIEKL